MKNLFFLISIFLFAGCTVVSNRTAVVTDEQNGYLSFDVKPVEAKIFVDNEFVGLAKYFNGKKRRLKILPGEHLIELKCPGYEEIRKRIYMSDTEEHFAYDMTPVKGDSRNVAIRT